MTAESPQPLREGARVAYLDCSTGVSGDKFLGALLDAGSVRGDFTPEHLRAIVASLAPEVTFDVERVKSHGITAMSVHVTAENDPPHRHWRDIERLLREAPGLEAPVRENALRAFETLALAEATVHGVDLDHVHFHEVGAIDSIVDIVGVCAGMQALRIESLFVSPIAVGSGTVQTSHGLLPVPAPATAGMLADVPVVSGPAAGELTTPTGIALAKTLATWFGEMPPLMVDVVGYGAGTRDIGMPNICRIMIAQAWSLDAADSATPGRKPGPAGTFLEPVVLLESNLDHLAPEELAFAAQQLLLGGALDVWQTPIVMKKDRSAVMLSLLAAPKDADRLAARFIELTGSLGVRRLELERSCAPREIREVATPWGAAHVKVGAGRIRPEHDDVARIAREHALPYHAVLREIERLAFEPDPIDER